MGPPVRINVHMIDENLSQKWWVGVFCGGAAAAKHPLHDFLDSNYKSIITLVI